MNKSTARPDDYVQIYLRDCAVPLQVGIYDYEKTGPQPVLINITAYATPAQRFDNLKADDVTLVMDYDRLYHFVTDVLPTLGHIPLLESLAERIIAFVFEDPRIDEVIVQLHKPDILKGKAKVGIEMRRMRRLA